MMKIADLCKQAKFALLAVGILIAGSQAQAQVVYEFQNGVNGYEGVQDTFFMSGDPLAVEGNSIVWEFDGEDAGGINYGMLNFEDLFGSGPNQIPLNSNVLEAFVTLTVVDSGSANATVHNLLKPFNEEMAFIDFTDNFEMEPGDDYEEEVIATLPGLTSGDVIRVDVTTSLQDWVTGGDYFGWLFIPGGTDGAEIQSSEFPPDAAPRLIVDTPLGEFVFQRGVDGYDGVVDTWINTGTNFESVYGQSQEIEWDGEDAGGQNFALIRYEDLFGDGPNQIPPGTEITSAHLRFAIIDPGSEASIHEILEGNEDEPTDFNETTTSMLEWGDFFAPRAGIDYDEEAVSTFPSDVGIIMIDVTSSVQKYSEGETNRGWIIVPSGTNGAIAVASEYGTANPAPRLIVDTSEGEFVFEENLNGYTGTHDTWLNTGNNVESVFGLSSLFEWDGSDAGGVNYGLLRFDGIIGTGANQIPPTATVNSARLVLNLVNPGELASIHEILEGNPDEPTDWDERTAAMINWGDTFEPRPGIDYNEDALASIEGIVGLSEIDVTSSIASYVAGEVNRGWIFVPTGTDGVEATSSNSGGLTPGPPKLTVIIEGEQTGIYDFSIY